MLPDEPMGWPQLQAMALRERNAERLNQILDRMNRLLDEMFPREQKQVPLRSERHVGESLGPRILPAHDYLSTMGSEPDKEKAAQGRERC